MKKLLFLAMVLCLFCSGSLRADILYAIDSSRTSLNNGTSSDADTVKSDSSKLSVRSDNKAAKSWIEFDVSGLDISSMTSCQLRVTLNAAKDNTCQLSAVNEGVTSGTVSLDGSVTWNTAPGNITSSDGVNPDDGSFTVDDLQKNLDPTKTTLIGTVDYSEGAGGAAGDQFFIDVLPILQADADGIVLFVLHNAGGSTDFATHDNSNGAEYWPALVYETLQAGDCSGVGTLVTTYADDSSRTELYDGTNARVNDVRSDGSKLSVRGDYKANKSWIEFDLNDLGLDPNNLKSATLRITLYEGKTGTCLLSAVNDNVTSGPVPLDGSLTWNNAPGNITSSDGVNPDDSSFSVDDLQDNLDPTKTTQIGTVDYSYGGLAGDQFFFNVLPILQADTDGVVLFALHGASGYTNFATHDNSLGSDYWPMLEILQGPAGADNPNPCPEAIVGTDLAGLSWTNPDPNDGVSPITCTVYLGTDPNRLQMDSKTLAPGSQGILINTTNFPTFGNLQNYTTYYWVVDCYDPSAGMIDGLMWSFLVNNNDPPVVDAGPKQDVWIGMSGTPGQEVVYLDGTITDDGLPLSPEQQPYTLWTQEETGAPAVVIDPNNVEDTSVTITERGDYLFKLTSFDGDKSASDTVRIVVGDDVCDASHIDNGAAYAPGDYNKDCIVNLEDFASLIAANWLDCTDTINNCGN